MSNLRAVLDYATKTLTTRTLKCKGGTPEIASALPDALAKACGDPFAYALGLKNGTILFFGHCKYVPGSEWIHLTGLSYDSEIMQFRSKYHSTDLGVDIKDKLLPIPFERGMDIRLADITWVADGPWGS